MPSTLSGPVDPNLEDELFDIYIRMFVDSLISYSIDLFAIYLYLSRLKRLHAFKKRELREEPE